jgi:hypothetical protein
MKKPNNLDILKENISALKEAVKWLERSYRICKEFNTDHLSEKGMDAFEGLTSRFARASDILFNKVYRSIIYIEKGQNLPWIDVVIYLEKKQVIDKAEDARLIKELRNDIVHEYAMTDLTELFKEVLNYTPVLLQYSEKAKKEAGKLKEKLEK